MSSTIDGFPDDDVAQSRWQFLEAWCQLQEDC